MKESKYKYLKEYDGLHSEEGRLELEQIYQLKRIGDLLNSSQQK